MRTTLTLDPDIAAYLKEKSKSEDKSFKETVNEVLRAGIAPAQRTRQTKFKVKAHRGGFVTGVDQLKLNQLHDELETEAFLEKERKGS